MNRTRMFRSPLGSARPWPCGFLLLLVACSHADASSTLLAEAEALASRVTIAADAGGPGIDMPKAPASDDARGRAFAAAVAAFYSEHVAAGEEDATSATVELPPPTAGIQPIVVHTVERLEPGERPLAETKAFHFDWVEGRVIRLTDLLTDPTRLEALALPAAAQTDRTDKDEAKLAPSAPEETWWRLTKAGLRLQFPAGHCTPEVEGPKVVDLPLARFADLRTPLGERVWRTKL